MKLTTRSEYALLALLYLARRSSDGYIPVETIARGQKIPPKFLEQILLTLKRSRYLKSLKGQHGGYCLAREAETISLAEIIRLFDGALAPTDSASKYYYESTPIEKEKKIIRLFKELRDYISDKLENITLADMC